MVSKGARPNILANVMMAISERQFKPPNELLPAILAASRDAEFYWVSYLITALTEAGSTEDAVAVARGHFVENIANDWMSSIVESWLAAGGIVAGEDILEATLAYDTPAEKRMEIADKLAEVGLLRPAVTLWLDVVRYHGDDAAQGIAAAACLVRSGHRAHALATVDEALAGRLSAPARTRLTALRAWMLA